MRLQIGMVVRFRRNCITWADLASKSLNDVVCIKDERDHSVASCVGIIKNYANDMYTVTIKFLDGCIHNVNYHWSALEFDIVK
jgi:hypothetical protein